MYDSSLSVSPAVCLPVAASHHENPDLALDVCEEHFQLELGEETT